MRKRKGAISRTSSRVRRPRANDRTDAANQGDASTANSETERTASSPNQFLNQFTSSPLNVKGWSDRLSGFVEQNHSKDHMNAVKRRALSGSRGARKTPRGRLHAEKKENKGERKKTEAASASGTKTREGWEDRRTGSPPPAAARAVDTSRILEGTIRGAGGSPAPDKGQRQARSAVLGGLPKKERNALAKGSSSPSSGAGKKNPHGLLSDRRSGAQGIGICRVGSGAIFEAFHAAAQAGFTRHGPK